MKPKVVISLTPGTIIAELVDSSYENPVIAKETFEWHKNGLGVILDEIIAKFNTTDYFRVLVSDQLCHIAGLQVEKKHSSDREHIKLQVATMIPEDLDIVKWDFVVRNVIEGNAHIQAFAFSKLLNEEFNSVGKTVKDKIQLILPTSLSLLESFAEKDQSFLLIQNDEINKVIVAVINGIAKFVMHFSENDAANKVEKSLSYVSKYLNFTPDKVVLSGTVNKSLDAELNKNFNVVNSKIVPVINILEVKRVAGSDKKVLNISFTSEKKEGVLLQLEESLKSSKSENNQVSIFIIILTIIALIGLGIGYLFVFRILT